MSVPETPVNGTPPNETPQLLDELRGLQSKIGELIIGLAANIGELRTVDSTVKSSLEDAKSITKKLNDFTDIAKQNWNLLDKETTTAQKQLEQQGRAAKEAISDVKDQAVGEIKKEGAGQLRSLSNAGEQKLKQELQPVIEKADQFLDKIKVAPDALTKLTALDSTLKALNTYVGVLPESPKPPNPGDKSTPTPPTLIGQLQSAVKDAAREQVAADLRDAVRAAVTKQQDGIINAAVRQALVGQADAIATAVRDALKLTNEEKTAAVAAAEAVKEREKTAAVAAAEAVKEREKTAAVAKTRWITGGAAVLVVLLIGAAAYVLSRPGAPAASVPLATQSVSGPAPAPANTATDVTAAGARAMAPLGRPDPAGPTTCLGPCTQPAPVFNCQVFPQPARTPGATSGVRPCPTDGGASPGATDNPSGKAPASGRKQR